MVKKVLNWKIIWLAATESVRLFPKWILNHFVSQHISASEILIGDFWGLGGQTISGLFNFSWPFYWLAFSLLYLSVRLFTDSFSLFVFLHFFSPSLSLSLSASVSLLFLKNLLKFSLSALDFQRVSPSSCVSFFCRMVSLHIILSLSFSIFLSSYKSFFVFLSLQFCNPCSLPPSIKKRNSWPEFW